MNLNIQPRYLNLNDLFSRRLFRIPEYQRAYSWGSKERADLFGDIKIVREKKAPLHFMATVVGLRRENKTIVTDEYSVVDVVDGQQRLTTLVILYKAIGKHLDREVATQSKIAGEIQELLVKPDQLSLLLLQTNHDTSHHFANYLRSGAVPEIREALTLADKALVNAMRESERFVQEWMKAGEILELIGIIKNKLTFIFHELDNESAVYTVFEVLNSRGLAVAWLDRLKSVLMAVAFENNSGNASEIIRELHSIWSDIYRSIGLRQGLMGEALRFAATLRSPSRPSKVEGEEDAAKILRDACGKNPSKAVEVSQWVLKVTAAVDKFLAGPRRARAVNQIAHARLLAVAIVLREFSGEEERNLMDLWERTSFRIFGLCQRDARTKVGAYVRLAWDAYRGLSPLEIRSRIIEIGEEEKDELSIDWAVEHLRDANCYEGWEEELRYLLFRYEEYLARKNNCALTNLQWERIWETAPMSSIEHILSQAIVEKNSRNIHRLGNLLLLPPGTNSSLQSRSPTDKATAYRETGLLCAREVADHLEELNRNGQVWGVKEIVEREERILEWVRREWNDK